MHAIPETLSNDSADTSTRSGRALQAILVYSRSSMRWCQLHCSSLQSVRTLPSFTMRTGIYILNCLLRSLRKTRTRLTRNKQNQRIMGFDHGTDRDGCVYR